MHSAVGHYQNNMHAAGRILSYAKALGFPGSLGKTKQALCCRRCSSIAEDGHTHYAQPFTGLLCPIPEAVNYARTCMIGHPYTCHPMFVRYHLADLYVLIVDLFWIHGAQVCAC